jgi:NADH dehydrogenase
MKKVIVLGAGYAGVLTAKKLEKKAKKANQEVEITLIDKNPFHTMLTELHEVAACRVDDSSIRIDLKKIFAGRNVNVVLDNISKVDYAQKSLAGQTKNYSYDYLVVATGCKPTYFGIPGAEEHGFPLWSYDDSIRLRDHIQEQFRNASAEIDPEKKKAMLNFFVVGGGFTGVEMAGELGEYSPIICKKYGIDPKDVQIHLIDFLDRIMPVIPKKITDKAMRRFEKIGVDVKLKTKVVSLGDGSIEYEGEDGKRVKALTNTVVWGAGTEGSEVAQAAEGLGLEPKTRGRIRTDKFLRSENDKNVYVAGDNMFYIPEGEKTSVPQMVENCEHCAGVIATNLLTQLSGQEPTVVYKPAFHGAMVCIGGRYAITHGGLPGKFFGMPSLFAGAAKHFINIIYFMQVLGWNKVGSYIWHEFMTIRNCRSITGGHFSNRSPTFLLMPLRFFTGNIFIYYFYRRFADASGSWFETDHLTPYFESLRRVFPTLIDINIFDQFSLKMFGGAGGYMHILFQATPISWFMETFVIASPSHIMFWQALIVITTLLIGLALVGGWFTTLASVYVIIYALVYMVTGGLSLANMWLIFAGIALMFGGGRSLSIDYYFMPWLKKKWKNAGWVKKWYLYND